MAVQVSTIFYGDKDLNHINITIKKEREEKYQTSNKFVT